MESKKPIEAKLTVEHLAPYLPYGLMFVNTDCEEYTFPLFSMDRHSYTLWNDDSGLHTIEFNDPDEHIKPILRPLSDFNYSEAYNEINEFHSLDVKDNLFNDSLTDGFSYEWLPYKAIEALFKHNFDVFGLIDAGVAIDINTLTT